MKFKTKKIGDKILVEMYVKGVRVDSAWMKTINSSYTSVKDLCDQLKIRYEVAKEMK